MAFVAAMLWLLWRIPPLEAYLDSSDLGYQMSLGRQVLEGKFPFLREGGLFFHYGPLTAFTSAAAILLRDSALSEAVVCAAGYAAALALMFAFVRRNATLAGALAVLVSGMLLLPRFYKWYYWLFPALVIYLLGRWFESGGAKKWAAAAGFAVGIAGLYRLDLGLACGVTGLAGWALHCVQQKKMRGALRAAVSFSAAAAAPLLAWLAVLLAVGGLRAPSDYVAFTMAGAHSAVSYMGLAFPRFEWRAPLGESSALFLAFVGPVVLYAAATLIALRQRTTPRPEAWKSTAIAAAAILGLCILPQALQRPDGHHLLQAFVPAIIVMGCMLRGRSGRWIAAGAVVAALLGLCVWRLPGDADLGPWREWPGARYAALRKGPAAMPRHPMARAILAAEAMTGLHDRVLVLPYGDVHPTQLSYFIKRPIAGLVNVYLSGLFSDDVWRLANLREVEARPPAIVIVGEDYFSVEGGGGLPDFSHFQPELLAYVRANYSETVYRAAGFVILRRPAASVPGTRATTTSESSRGNAAAGPGQP